MPTGLENLKIYQMVAAAEIEIYKLTKKYPRDEKYRSIDQLRRSSSSVSNNIAEMYNKRSLKEKIRILNDIVKCEAEETKRNLTICAKKGFCEDESLKLSDKYTEIIKATSGYIRFLKNNLQT